MSIIIVISLLLLLDIVRLTLSPIDILFWLLDLLFSPYLFIETINNKSFLTRRYKAYSSKRQRSIPNCLIFKILGNV